MKKCGMRDSSEKEGGMRDQDPPPPPVPVKCMVFEPRWFKI